MRFPFRVVAAALLLVAARLTAQCATSWTTTGGADAGVNGPVEAMVEWDPDGAGPRGPLLVVGGYFSIAGNVIANGIATFDPATGRWSQLGGGVWRASGPGGVAALIVMPDNALVVAGGFSRAGSVAAENIVRWNGATWAPLGPGLNGGVVALDLDPSGNLIAGGDFTYAGSIPRQYVARWNGTAWSGFGSSPPLEVKALKVLPDGDIVVAVPDWSSPVRRLHSGVWTTVGASFFSGVDALACRPNGDLYAFGTLMPWTTTRVVARWLGSSWLTVGTATGRAGGSYLGRVLLPRSNGDLLVAGDFTAIGGVAGSVASYNGRSWSAAAGLIGDSITTLVEVHGTGAIIAGGVFTVPGRPHSSGVALWNGTNWSQLQSRVYGGADGLILDLIELPGGGLACGGFFDAVGGIAAHRVAAFDGTNWSDLGGGVDSSSEYVNALAALPNGDLIAGGKFESVGGVAAKNLARWDGLRWHDVDGGADAEVKALVVLPDGSVAVGGNFRSAGGLLANRIARWDGATWSTFGSGMDLPVYALAVADDGVLIAGGSFLAAGGAPTRGLARWSGTAWSAIGGGVPGYSYAVRDLAVVPGGGLAVVCGSTLVMYWDGSSWTSLGGSFDYSVESVVALPGGDLIVGGTFGSVSGVPATRIARWSGAGWTSLGYGVLGPHAVVMTLAGPTASGEVLVGGGFDLVDYRVSPNLAMLATTCLPGASSVGAGCAGSGGTLVLEALSPPWLGGWFRSRCAGLSASGLAIGLIGLRSPGIPLSLLHPAGGVGCNLLASSELLLPLIVDGGVAAARFGMPLDPTLAGTTLQHQVLQVEFGPGLGIVGLTSSNGLTLTLGLF
ncbi:MAG: hypothetical protein KDC98_16295 [Planctomycetes bacterium]|nr:hypothetical protein [Planctomycetota bacterium]